MKNKNLLIAAFFAFAFSLIMISCNKSASSNSTSLQNLSLYLTDGPGLFNKVMIDIRSVKVLVDTSKDTRKHDGCDFDRMGANDQKNDSSMVWENLNIAAGVYDLLQLRNGTDTLLAASGISKGAIRVIKIEIGTNNSVTKDSVTYPLTLPAGAPNYILIKLRGDECEEYLPGKNRLWLDFDVARSILQGLNSQFELRPAFHFFVANNTGNIAGQVLPMDAAPVVAVFNGTDTAYAIPDKDGHFKVRGLADGTYTVYVNASNGYFGTVINNVQVKSPKESSVGVITLRK